MKNILFILAISLATSTDAQICGQMFIAPPNISYDAHVTYLQPDGKVESEYDVRETNYLLIPSCSTQASYTIELSNDGEILDKFVIHYENGQPLITHEKSSGLIECAPNSY